MFYLKIHSFIRIVRDKSILSMSEIYPFEWRENSEEDRNHRAKFWTSDNSIGVHHVISSPMEVNMPAFFVKSGVHERIWNLKPREDDIWLVTYPKCGTTMSQELLWQMSRGCNINSEESKTQLFTRSPFLEMGGMRLEGDCINKNERPVYLQDPITYAESLKSPRILKTHLPVSMLPPSVLKTSKVIVVARNVKDACVSFYHHEKLLKHHGWSGSFEDYVEFFMDGKPGAAGNYWVHLKVKTKNSCMNYIDLKYSSPTYK